MDKNKHIRLSVIIPTYNYGNYIKKTLLSIIRQNYFADEIIVIDDGSTDSTKTIVDSFRSSHLSHNILYFYQKNKGVSSARNLGYVKSSSKYLMFLDSDDELLPNAFDSIDNSIKAHRNADMIFFGYLSISHKNVIKERLPKQLNNDRNENVVKLLEGGMVGLRSSSTILNRNVMKLIKYPENVHVGEDTLFFAKIFYNFDCASIPNVIVQMPRHSGSLRDNYQRNLDSGTNGINELFNLLPRSRKAIRLNKHMLSRRYLQLGRLAYLQQDYATSNKYYINAIKVKLNSIISIKHAPRFICSLVKTVQSIL